MPLWGFGIQVLLIAVCLIQQSASPAYAQTNFALNQEVTVSSNDTCGVPEKEEFCAAIDQHRKCRQFDLCSSRCSFAETTPGSVDLVATGIFHGEVMLVNQSSSACHAQLGGNSVLKLNGTSGFISKLLDGPVLFHEFQGLTLTVHVSQDPRDEGGIITVHDNSGLVFGVSANSSNQQISLEYVNASGFISIVPFVKFNLSDGRCHHVAVVLFNSTIQLFYDGLLVAEEITYKNLWNRTGNIFLSGVPNGSMDDYFKGELGSAHLFMGPLLPSEIRAHASGRSIPQPRLAAHCRCHMNYPSISADVNGIYCVNPKTKNSVRRIDEKAHFGGLVNDGNIHTWWQSKRTRVPVNLTVSLGGIKQALHVKILFRWCLPEAFILLKSADNGSTWTPWQYYAKDCRTSFNLRNHGKLDFPDSVNCMEGFSISVPGETVSFYLLESPRPGADSFESNQTLQQFSFATHVRLSMVSFFGNLAEKTDYFAVSELEVYGRNCTCPVPENVSSCQCNGSIIKPPNCSEALQFDSDRYTRSIFDQTPAGVPVLQVHATSLCTRSVPVYYSIIERNDSGAFEIENTTGLLKLRSYVLLNSTFHFLIGARQENGLYSGNASTLALIKVVARETLTARTNVDFETKKLGFPQGKRKSNVMRQFGFFVNGYPGNEGSLRASVGAVGAEVNYTTTRERATYVKAVLVSKHVYYDRPAVHVIAQVQDSSFNVRTLVDESEVVVKVVPSANLTKIDGSLLQVNAKPSASNGIAAIQVPLPSQWFSDPSLVNPEIVSVTYRLRNSGLPPELLGNTTIHAGPNTQLFLTDVYGVLPLEPVYVGRTFSFSIYCDSSFAVASFGIKLLIGPSLAMVGSQIDGQRWLHVAVNHSSTEWIVSGTLTDPEAAPQGAVKKAKMVSFDVKVKDTAVVDTNATLAVEVVYLSNVNNEEAQIDGKPLPAMAAMIDGSDQSRHTLGTIQITGNDVTELIPYAEPSELVNTAVINGHMVTTNMKLLAVQRSGDITMLSKANCTSLSKAIQVTKNCSKVFLNGSESEGSPEAQVRVEFGNLMAFVSFRVWFPVLPLNLTLKYPDLAQVLGWLEFNACSGQCVQRYQWSEVQSEALFSYDGIHFENISTTSFVRDLLTSVNESVAIVDSFGKVHGMSPGRTIIRAVNPLDGVALGSADVTVSSLRRVDVKLIDIVMVTNLSVSIPAPPYHRLSTQMAVASVHQDLRRDHTRGALVACVTFSDGRRQILNSKLGLTLKSLDEHVLRVTSQSEAISVGSGAGVLQADWSLAASVCHPSGFSLGVGYEMTNVSLSPPIRLEITGISPQITVPGDASTVAGIPTSSPIAVTLVFENGHRVDMSSDTRTVYDLSQSDGFFTVDRDENNLPMITANTQGKFGKKDLVVRFTHFAISDSVTVNIVKHVGFALHANPYPPYPGLPLIDSLSRIADTSSHEMASLELSMVMSDASNYDVTTHALTSFSSRSADVIVGQSPANRVIVRPGVTSQVTAVLDGHFSGVGKMDFVMYVKSSSVTVLNITNLAITPEKNLTLSGLENSIVAQVQLSLTFNNGRRVEQFYDRGAALFPGLITLTSENNQIFTVDSTTGQVTLRQNYHQTLSLTATAASSVVTSAISVTCNLQPGIGDVDLGEVIGLPLFPRAVGSSFQTKVRLNAGGGPGVKKMDLTLSYDQTKLAATSVRTRSIWSSCVLNLNSPGQISLDCDSDSFVTGVVEVADITFNATSSGVAAILGSVTTDLGSSSLVAGDVDQKIVASGKRKRRNLDDGNRQDVFEAHARRMRRSLFCASPPCQCVDPLPPGDVNKDCLFDLSDVLFVLKYFSFSHVNFSSAAGNLFFRSLTPNQSRDVDVDRNTVVNPSDAFYLVRAFLDLVRLVSDVSVTPVQLLSSDCKLSFSITLSSKNGPASDSNTFVFFDVTYSGVPVDFAGITGSLRGFGVNRNLIRGVSQGNGSFSVQAPFELVQESIGLSVFYVTLASNNRTSVTRSAALLGNPRPPFIYPFRLSIDLIVASENVKWTTINNYNPFVRFNNTLSSAACKNNFTPQFEHLVYHANVSENATVNSSIITVNATDQDSGNSGKISYSLVNHESLPFAVNATSGDLRIVKSLDREQKARYNLTVRATDGGAPGREKFAHAHIIVKIGDVNDNAPVVNEIIPGHLIKIPENAVIDNPLARVIASDADVGENAVLHFSFHGNSSWNGTFAMNSTSGEVMLNSSLQGKVGEIYKIVVLVTDRGTPALTTNSTFEFRVTYASDVEVFFTSEFYQANVTENSAENASVVQVKAYVPGLPSAFIVYFLVDTSPFKIDPRNGHVLLNTTVDRETSEFFSLTVTAQYGQNISTNATINITILDQNDNDPVPYPVPLLVIPYNLPAGSEVYRINASDRDIGGNAVLNFYLLKDVFSLFVIDKESGMIFLNSSLLDFDESFLQLLIEVSDSGLPPLSSNITVNISVFFAPRFSHNISNITVSEDISTGTVVHTFAPSNISGQDMDTYFTISNGNNEETFSVQNVSGEVYVQGSLDREQKSFYSLSIQAWNFAVQRFDVIQPTQLFLNITVGDVNDNAPYLEAIQPITIKNTAHVGYTLVRVNATDSDEGLNAQLQYKITSGDELNKFSIDDLGFLQLNTSLFYDSIPSFSLTINVSDHGSPMLYNTTQVSVTVQDDRSPPRFNQTFYNASLPEDILPGSEVVAVFGTDPNGDTLFYNMSYNIQSISSIFQINFTTGRITTLAELDRESEDLYQFDIIAYKISPLTGEKYLDNATVHVRVLDVNDVSPHFDQRVYTVELSEENSPGAVLVSVHANDSDKGINALLSYAIVSGNDSVFNVNSTSGEITVLVSLDYETVHQLSLTVQAKDHGIPPLDDNASVVINIRDINDNAPVVDSNLTENLTLLENVPQETFVVKINASDADSGLNSNLSFTIVDGNINDAFTINSSHGVITTASLLDFERVKFYTLNVTVQDQGIPPLSSSVLVKIEVIDVNDMTPVIHGLSPVYVRENIAVDTVIARVNATDGDSGMNAVLNFTIASGNLASDFTINKTSGVITTAHVLDHENVSEYRLNISVTDNGIPPLSSNAILPIYVIDVNDHRPIFTQDLYEVSVYENITVNTTVLRVHARDLDSSTAGGIVYSFEEGNYNDTFVFNSSSGEIKLAQALDFEDTKQYLIVVKAIDTFLPNNSLDVIGAANDSNSSISLFSYANVSMTVLDVNDNQPQFVRDLYPVLINENFQAGALVAQVSATDQDSGENAVVSYKIFPPSSATALFVINASSGEVRTNSSLRDVNYMTIDLLIIASDGGSPPLNSTVLLQVRIDYNVTFKYNETNPFTYLLHGAFQLVSSAMLSRVRANTKIGLFSQMPGSLQASAGNVQWLKRFELLKESAMYIKAFLVSDWPDYQGIRIAVQVFDRNFNVKTAPTKVYFKFVNLITNSEVNMNCVPSTNTGICVGRWRIPKEWLNITISSHTVSLKYGLLPSNMVELNKIHLAVTRKPRVDGNFVILAPLHLLHVGDVFSLYVYAQYPKLVKYYTLICTLSSGLKIKHVDAAPSWSVQTTFNGVSKFVVFGVRMSFQSEEIAAYTTLHFTINIEVTENADLASPEYMECTVSQVSDQEGNQIIDAPMKAVFEDRFGRHEMGQFVVVQHNVKALFIVPEYSVIFNTALLNGKRIDVAFVVYGVTAQGQSVNVTDVACRSFDVAVLKASSDCSSVYVNGSETHGSTNATIEISHRNLTVNFSFIVWTPITPISLSVTLPKLKRIRDWYDPNDSCKSRYQHTRVTARADFSELYTGVDVTQHITNNLRSSNTTVAEIVGLNIHGKNVGRSTVEVYIGEHDRTIGQVVIEVTNEDTRVYFLDAIVATRVFVALPKLLNNSLEYEAIVDIDERFYISEDEGWLVVSVQYSDGVVNTFDNLSGFFINSTNISAINVQGGSVSAVKNNSGDALHVVMHSGHCAQQPIASSFVNVDVNFQEPVSVLVTSTSRQITPRVDPVEKIGVPLSTEITVFPVYNISGREQRIDMSRDSRTIYNLEIGGNLANFTVTEQVVVISASGSGFGRVELSITFTHVRASARVIVDVVGAQELRFYASPYPAYNSSVAVNITHLNPIGNSGMHQQARLNLFLVLSNGTERDVTRHSRTQFEVTSTQPAELAQSSSIKDQDGYHVVTVQWRSGRGQVAIGASFMGVSGHVLNLQIESTPLTVTSVEFALPPNLTLSGLRDNATLQLSVNLEFSDNSKLRGLFSSENTTLYDLVTFSTQDTTKITVNETSGLITLKSNSPQDVRVTVIAAQSPSVKDTIAFACNLAPDVGDVDIGDVIGVPLKTTHVGGTFTAAVRINSGNVVLGSFDVEFFYDSELLEVDGVSEGADMVGFFITVISSQTGKVRIAGALSVDSQKHHLRHVADVKFRVTSGGTPHVRGTVLMIASDDLFGSVIGLPVPRGIVAGDVEKETGDSFGRLRRSSTSGHAQLKSNTRVKRSVVPCPSPPCSSCPSGREPGDTDGNCIFDIRDIKFALAYITEKQFNFSRAKGQQIQNTITQQQLQSLDTNGDGSVTLNDVNLLLGARVNMVPLFPKLSVAPVEDPKSQCLLTISLPASELGVTASDTNRTKIFFDVSHSEQNFSNRLLESVFTKGRLETTEKGSGIIGGIIQAEFNSADKTFVTSLNTSLLYSNVGLSFIQVWFSNDGSIDFSKTLLVNGKFTQPPLYQGELNATLDLGNSKRYSVQRPNGYNPYTFFNNSLASTNCSDVPLLKGDLLVNATDARKIFASWKLSNVRKGLNFSFILTLRLCDPALLNEPCKIQKLQASGTNHTVAGLSPYTNYSVKVETTGIPVRETRWEVVQTLESVPEGVRPPVLEATSFSSLNASWTEPDHPNGVIISYSLHMRNMSTYTILYQGSSMSYYVTGLSAGQEYFFYIMANTSVGGTKSTIVGASVPVEMTEPTSGARTTGLSVGLIVGITVAGAAIIALLIVLVVWLVRKHSDRPKPRQLDYSSLLNYNSLHGNSRDNLMMQMRSTSSSLRETSLARGRMYEHHFSIDGLENPWREQDSSGGSNDPFAMVNHTDFEPSPARNEHWDRGYEETVLKEAVKEMNNLDVAVKENIDSEGPVNGFTGQQFSLHEDNLVHMTSLSQGQSSFSPENTKRKKSKKNKEGKEPVSEGSIEWDYYYGANASTESEEGPPVDTKSRGQIRKARQLAEEMIQRLANGDVNKEYRGLAAERTEGSWLCANDPVNLPKNRYRNILPFDHSRVKLMQGEEEQEGGDYINANFLDGFKEKNAYIATQGPLNNTIADFWQMVWEQNVHVIVMLTRLQEGKKVKCVKYWPDTDEEVTFGDFVITSTYKRKLESRVVRRFILENSGSGECRELTYFQFTAWPDFGIPSSPADFLELYYEIMQEYKSLPVCRTPMLVHCSAGVGRSGAFCAINNCLHSFRSTGKIDVAESVRGLRKQRSGMVQTLEQYVFCYKCLVLALLYQIKLKKLKGTSLLSQSALSSSGVWTTAEISQSPQESLNTQSRLQSPSSERSQDSLTSRGAPPYSYSQRMLPPVGLHEVPRGIGHSGEESQGDDLPPVVVHSTPKKFVSKKAPPFVTFQSSEDDDLRSGELSHGDPQNMEVPVGATGRRKTTGDIRKRPDLGAPPPPPPPPPPPTPPPSVLPNENELGDADSFPELPEVDYIDFNFSEGSEERYSPPLPPPPEEFFLPVEDEQPANHFDSSA